MTDRKNAQKKTKVVEGAVAAVAVDTAEAARADASRRKEQRETLDMLGKLGLTSYDHGGGRIHIHFGYTDDEIVANIGGAGPRDVLPAFLTAIYKAGVEAGRSEERETQADALMAAVPSLADRMRRIAEQAIRDAKLEERLKRNDY